MVEALTHWQNILPIANRSARMLPVNATLDRFGRIVIPKRLRDHLGLEAGSVLEIQQRDGDRIVLRVRREEPDLSRVDGVLVYGGEATGDLERAVEAQREARSAEAAAWEIR